MNWWIEQGDAVEALKVIPSGAWRHCPRPIHRLRLHGTCSVRKWLSLTRTMR